MSQFAKPSQIRIVFFGTPDFGAQLLEYLIEQKLDIVGIVTQPDRPQKRSFAPMASPVKQIAQQQLSDGVLLQPEKASEESFLTQLRSLQADLYVVVAYGQILSQRLLDIPPLGCINVHASLLPKYRGAAPMQRCLMDGEKETGVSIQKMVKQMDAGDVIDFATLPISSEMNLGQLQQSLCEISKPLLLDVIRRYENQIPSAIPQAHEQATFAPKISAMEGKIQWEASSEEIHNRIRALSPKPGAWTVLRNSERRMKLLKAQCVDATEQGKPGDVLQSKQGMIACGKGVLQLLEVQPEGKKPMLWKEWIQGATEFCGFCAS